MTSQLLSFLSPGITTYIVFNSGPTQLVQVWSILEISDAFESRLAGSIQSSRARSVFAHKGGPGLRWRGTYKMKMEEYRKGKC